MSNSRLDRVAPLAVVTFDIDWFKQVNDKYGHPDGGRTLCSIPSTVHREIRNGDLIGRMSGEEFRLVLPDTSAEASHVLAERLRMCQLGIPI